jgi:hypothetical protein
MFAESKHRKDRFFKGEQAFTMLKHRFSALMIFHDAETPLCSTVHFSDAETPLCSTVHFSDAETPLKNTGDCFPDAETPLIGTFHFFPVTETSHSPHHSHSRNNSVQHLFRFFPLPLLQHHSQQLFPLPKHQQPFIPLLLLKHRLSATFHPFPPMLKHHCSAFFFPFPSSFSPPIIDETIPSSNCFASFVAETPFAKQPFIIHPRC